jgi:hypothetical protein
MMCSVLELGGIEWNSSIPAVFHCSVRINARNRMVPYLVGSGIARRNGTIYIQFFLQIIIKRGKKERERAGSAPRGGRAPPPLLAKHTTAPAGRRLVPPLLVTAALSGPTAAALASVAVVGRRPGWPRRPTTLVLGSWEST